MEHAKKMILVTPEALSSVKDRPVSPAVTNVAKLDRELQQILERHDLLPFDKVQLYNQVLQRYLTYYNQSAKKPIAITVSRDKSFNVHDSANDPVDIPPENDELLEGAVGGVDPIDADADKLLMNFPVSLKTKAKSLLELIKNSGGILNYNEHGELLAEGEVVPGSHISDVIYDVLLGKKGFEPRGWEQFVLGLIKMNVPERIVTNASRRYKMIKMKQQGLTSPGTTESTHFSSPPPPKKSKKGKKRASSKAEPIKKVKGRLNWESYPSS